ncbi:NACHT, LRR and PYD domains-containing protein 3-like [Boleophthalmus pectinirostris]|uniref:NACHT, LRR and PYD domains-containing protein 3-like n=1 Tax=Boleophthalmus pectinirostris TaxID=150288 RepID=UPI00242E3460|nr:NACHT, LRR and PYD domains-containing protein 3-like [Boleophthalmus pectinirostris]
MAESKLVQLLERHESLIKSRPQSLYRTRSVNEVHRSTEQSSSHHTSSPESHYEPVPVWSHGSMTQPIFFKDGLSANQSSETESRPDSLPRGMSIKSDASMRDRMLFNKEPLSTNQRDTRLSSVTVRSDDSTMETILEEQSYESLVETRPDLDNGSIFKKLEEHILSFVQNELRKLQEVLMAEEPESLAFDEDDKAGIKEAFLKIALSFLKTLDQDELAERLHNRQCGSEHRNKLKSDLQQRFSHVFEGGTKAGNSVPLTQIYTELYITEGGASEVNQEGEVRHMETMSRRPASLETIITCEDMFKVQKMSNRVVLMKGVAGVGKTVLTQKFSLDWAEGRAHQDFQLLFPFTFRELNVLRDRQFSLVGLLHHFLGPSKGLCRFQHLQVLFIFDGLDECRPPLDFSRTRVLRDTTEITSVHVLLVNLIRGSLLPSAHLWITTRPAAANQIPAECISMVTEVRGFTDAQKEQYFRKRCRDQATAIISHIKSIRSLHIMCRIPVFCWILSTVLLKLLEQTEEPELPRTLTNLYIHFLVVQLKQKNIKYDDKLETGSAWSAENKKMVQSLGRLAFEQLQKNNLIFYENDLSEYGLDATVASVYSGVVTDLFKGERGLYEDHVYSFIHPSVQEFLAALHVHHTFFSSGENLLLKRQASLNIGRKRAKTVVFYCSAVDQALQSPNGHMDLDLDLFLRFLLGLSLEENQKLLRGLTKRKTSSQNNQKTTDYIKKKLDEGQSPDRSMNLFHCLNELNDRSLEKEIQKYMRAERLSWLSSPAEWSAVGFILLSSGLDLEEFDLRKLYPSETALVGLLPVVKASTKALLIGCGLSPRSCGLLASVLSSSSLTHLDLSDNDLQDSGVELLCSGLNSTSCKIETLRLCGCGLSSRSCGLLASVLSSSSLTHLNLSDNNLQDSGVELLCSGLKSAPCSLVALSLSGCLVSEEGCTHLNSALNSNPSHLEELDLSYNHPGQTGGQLLQALVREPRYKLRSLKLDPCGPQWLKPGFKKYSVGLTWDMDSVHPRLRFSDRKTAVMSVNDNEPYPEHPDRFDWFYQLLCAEELCGRSYFQVQWSGHVHVAVTYRGLQRKGKMNGAYLGRNEQSWCLFCSDEGFSVWHNDQETVLPHRPGSRTVGVYVDSDAGVLSFYCVADKLTLLHSFSTTFTQPLVPAFGFRFNSQGSLVVLCSTEDHNQIRHRTEPTL